MARNIGLIIGLTLLAITLILPAPAGLSEAAWLTAGVGLLMAVWWATEALPVPATSLVPLVLFPLLGLGDTKSAAAPYAHPVVFLLLGGFIIATALERWHLHRRIALSVLVKVGNHPHALVAGFMAATAFLSMWISNTATTIMMVPIALSLAQSWSANNEDDEHFALCLLLSIAYAASIGGLGTLIGTPPNAMLASFMSQSYNIEIGFLQWMSFGVPMVLLLLPLSWLLLTRVVFKLPQHNHTSAAQSVSEELAAMGSITTPQQRTAMVFGLIAMAWICRPLLQQVPGLEALNDTIIAIAGALALFLFPAGDNDNSASRLLDWASAQSIPWGVLLLFGGGLSLASMVNQSGLALWLGDALSGLTRFHMLMLVLCLVSLVIFLTELTSNVATTATLLPIVGSLAVSADFNPMLLAAPMCIAASCAFMLPVATAPNAIVYASGKVSIPQMARAGVYLNIIGILVISTLSYLAVPLVFL